VSIDTGGLAPDDVVEPGGGAAWVVVRDARSVAQPSGRVAAVDVERRVLARSVEVVAGCDIGALAAGDASVWIGTCDAFALEQSGAEVVELAAADGAIGTRVPLPVACVSQVAVGGGALWVLSAATSDAPARILRVEIATGAVDERVTVPVDESVLGLVADAGSVWTSRRGPGGSRLVRSDAATGAELVAAPTAPSRLLGVVDGILWAQDLEPSAVVARDAASLAVRSTTPVGGLRSAAAGPDGVWYQAASPGSLRVTIGRVDTSGAASEVVSYTGAGPDRTGLPFLGTLSATRRGAWFATQDRLFLVEH
jgi:hypothetical protein